MVLMDQNTYVEKVVLKNALAQPPQIQHAKAVAQQRGVNLLQVLQEDRVLTPEHVNSIMKLYERWRAQAAQPGAQATLPAAAPVAVARAAAPAPGAPVAPSRPVAPPPSRAVPQRPAARPAAAPSARPSVQGADCSGFTKIDQFLRLARDMGASDIHINAGCPPLVRKDGKLQPLNRPPFTPEEVEKLLFGTLTEDQRKIVLEKRAFDFCYAVPDQGRYRTCILKQRNGWDGAFRIVKSEVPKFEELALPESLKRLTEFHQGLVLITGPNGSGKSTTMASLVNLVNETRDEHIITIEDPVEYLFETSRCQVNQREVGTSTKSFPNALRAALREDPDVIMIGELRDKQTVSLAISASETGHLVFGTLHTTSAARTIDRILDVFPPDEQAQIRSMVSESIKGIVCQQLIPRKDGNGRALAMEILFNNAACANLIRERRMFQLPSVMQSGRKQGMILMDDALMKLVKEGVIDGAEAYSAADNKSTFAQWAPKVA